MECPICEYPFVRPRYRLGDRFFRTTDDEFELYSCASCGLLYQLDAGVESRLEEFYPAGYWWDQQGPAGGLERIYREWVVRRDQLGFIQRVIPAAPEKRLLDIGCGSGTFVGQALEAGFDAWGVDSSSEAVGVARKAVPGRITLGREENLIEAGKTFQVVTLFHTLEHIPRPFAYLKTLKKLIEPEGNLFVQVPNRHSLQARLFGSRWYGLDCPRHIYNYTTFSLLHLLGRAGYKIKAVRQFSLRDNAASFVSSLFPVLDPMSARVRALRRGKPLSSTGLVLRSALYFPLTMAVQPLAWLEAAVGRGATVTVWAALD